MSPVVPWRRILLAGPIAGVVWLAAVFAIFGPAQAILSDPAHQSPKVVAVFTTLEPPPLAVTTPWAVALGFLVLATVYSAVYAILSASLPGAGWRKGVSFGLLLWLVQILWFEFFMLWNVLREPAALVLLELALWLLVTQILGIAIALLCRPRQAAMPAV